MNLNYTLTENIIIIEFALIIVAILASLTAKLISVIKEYRKRELKVHIENHLRKLIKTREVFQEKNFQNHWRQLDILLYIVNAFDKERNEEVWQTIRLALIRSIILPLARKTALNKNWVSQFYAAQSFELYAEDEDRDLITTLINSPMPIIRLAALKAAIKYGSASAFHSIILEIQHQPQLTQSVYIQAFANAPETTRPYIETILKNSSDPRIRLTCYRILLGYPPEKIDWDISADIQLDNEQIKLSALRYLVYVEKESSIPILVELLKDEHWKTKVVVLNALGYLQAEHVIPQIAACLHDKNGWVRLNAAQALKNLGEKGELALISGNTADDPKAFEVMRHVLQIL